MNSNLKNKKKGTHFTPQFIITTIIAILAIIPSLIQIMSIEKKAPNLIVTSYKNNYQVIKHNNIYYNNYLKKEPNNLKIVNIGNSPAKNISFIWDENNIQNLLTLINKIDKDKVALISATDNTVSYRLNNGTGLYSYSPKNLSYEIDYLLSEGNESNEITILFPYEYTSYIDLLCYLSSYYKDYNFLENLTLTGTLTYEDKAGKKYNQIIKFKPLINLNNKDNYSTYHYRISPQTL